jgi:PAS domain S-box-containing protein
MPFRGSETLPVEVLVSQSTNFEALCWLILRTAMRVTGSGNGFVGIIDPISKALEMRVFGDVSQCLMKEKAATIYPDKDGKYPGLFGHALNERKAFYTNNPKAHPASKGTPEGHVPIHRFMAVPVALGEKLLGLIALANPEKDYTEEDLEKVEEIGRYYALALEHYRLEHELRVSRAWYETLFDYAPGAKLVVEENDIISQVNREFEELTGYSRKEVVGKMKWQQFIHHEDVQKLENYKRIRLAGGPAPNGYEARTVDREGKVHNIKIYSKPAPGTRKIIATVVDITEEKKVIEQNLEYQRRLEEYAHNLEKMVEEKVKELKEKETLATLGQMTLMVAHDLRNPMQAISNYTFLLDEAVKGMPKELKERLTKYVESIEKNVNYMNKIVQDLQYLGKREAKLEPTNLRTLVEESLKQFQVSEKIKVTLDVDNVQAQLDQNLITRALSNLILNSIQAMPDGGTLTVKAKSKEDVIEFTVQDTGIGMTEEVKKRIFEPFYTTKSKGMGLGLTIVKHIVNLHNGTVEVESEPNKGTKITIRIPKKKSSNRSIPE